jgi:hypothetical protein
MEHRWGFRYPVDVPARIAAGNGQVHAGHLRDVSITGALLATGARLDPLMALGLSVPFEGLTLQLSAWVVRSAESGYGVEWQEGGTLDLDLLMECVLRRSGRSVPVSVTCPATTA